MEHTTRQLQSSDVRLHVEQWLPEGPPRFAVCVSHGAAEHMSRYARLAGWFGERGGMTFGADHRGQGKSGGPGGHVESFHVYGDDLGNVVRAQIDRVPADARPDKIPWFLFGHSMGGLIALTYLLDQRKRHPFAGAIISAPLLGLTLKVPPLKLKVGQLAARFLPRLTLPSGLPPSSISRDPVEVEANAFAAALLMPAHFLSRDLRAPLDGNPLISSERVFTLCTAAEKDGYTLRRAGAEDATALLSMIERSFAPVWAYEVARALGPHLGGEAAAHTPELPEGAAVHVAYDRSDAPVAFAAHDGNNRGLGWFGPMGTLEDHRGHGLGEALLLRCLMDVRQRPEGGVIAWVGPASFYTRTCGAVPDRRFVVYEET